MSGGSSNYRDFSLNNSALTMQFLNRDGLNQSYTLSRVSLSAVSVGSRLNILNYAYATDGTSPLTELSLTYQDASGSQTVVVSIFIIDSNISVSTSNQVQITIRNSYNLPTVFVDFVRQLAMTNGASSITELGALSLFNMLDYGLFYTQQYPVAADGCKVNYLFNRFVFQMPDTTVSSNITNSPYTDSIMSNQAATGNMLCWGSNTNLGTFQTHMRDNYALWAGFWSVLFFWLAILFGEATSLNCFDRGFQNNKWTCWSIYSLFHLAHEDFFSRMSRTVPLYIIFCWQACVCAVLYSSLNAQFQDATTIPWYAAIAWACSLPLNFVYGAFTKRMYVATLDKFNQRKNIKKLFDKESNEAHVF
jgi:hypothetical protein